MISSFATLFISIVKSKSICYSNFGGFYRTAKTQIIQKLSVQRPLIRNNTSLCTSAFSAKLMLLVNVKGGLPSWNSRLFCSKKQCVYWYVFDLEACMFIISIIIIIIKWKKKCFPEYCWIEAAHLQQIT